MKYEDILPWIGRLRAIDNESGKILYDFVLEAKPERILEIGFFHGKSTHFMAAALDELGRGQITSIDLEEVRSCTPSILDLGKSSGLGKYINPIFSPVGSQWELRSLIRDNTSEGRCTPIYDLCFIDAYHSWEKAGMDFFLSDKLLKPGGWMLFDDLAWSFSSSPSWRMRPETQAMPQEFRDAPQVGEVFELLAKQHPDYENFSISNNWGWAQKKKTVGSR